MVQMVLIVTFLVISSTVIVVVIGVAETVPP